MNHAPHITVKALCLALCLAAANIGAAQQRLVAEVKKNIGALTLSAKNLQNEANKLKPALTNDETKDNAETWYVAGKIQYAIYDKLISARSTGQKVAPTALGNALIAGYDYFRHALRIDTIIERDKDGIAKIDRKTGKPKFKTKYSDDIISRMAAHLNDYNQSGSQLYNVKNWDGATRAWDIFCQLAPVAKKHKHTLVPDSMLAKARYYQGIASWQAGNNRLAAERFQQARTMGYHHKEAYDYALICLSSLKDEAGIVAIAKEAYNRFGTADPQYIRILINNYIDNKNFNDANILLDKALQQSDNDDELHNLKGLVVEQQSGLDDALPHFKRCIELNPNNPQGLYNVGRYYYNQAANVIEQNPNLRGRALSKRVDPLYRQAMPHLEQSLQLDPTNDDVRNALRNIYYKLGLGAKLDALEKRN